jgi:hypothetical protein
MMSSNCVESPMAPESNGYTRTTYKGKRYGSHRLAYALANGLNPNDLTGIVMHTCDNRRCINPAHLVLGTHQDNMDDMVAKGRSDGGCKQAGIRVGEQHPASKLTAEDVINIRSRPRDSTTLLAAEFGIKRDTVCKILSRRIWKHI